MRGVRWRAAATRWLLLLLARELGDRVGRRRQVGGGHPGYQLEQQMKVGRFGRDHAVGGGEDGLRNPAVGGRLLRGVLQPVGDAGQLERSAGDAGPARRPDASAGPAPVPRRSPSATGPAAGSSARRRRRPRSSPRRFRSHAARSGPATAGPAGAARISSLKSTFVVPDMTGGPSSTDGSRSSRARAPQQPENDSNLSRLPWLVSAGSDRRDHAGRGVVPRPGDRGAGQHPWRRRAGIGEEAPKEVRPGRPGCGYRWSPAAVRCARRRGGPRTESGTRPSFPSLS
jgi:hypothetical protein